MITQEFLESLPSDVDFALLEISKSFLEFWASNREFEDADYEIALDYYAFVQVYAKENSLDLKIPGLITNQQENGRAIASFFQSLQSMAEQAVTKKRTITALDRARSKYQAWLGKEFAYEFSDADLERIQTLINELRSKIGESTKIEETHRRRLLAKLERLQLELHKRVSDIDRFWGLVGDAGVALRKFGEDAKPIVERMTEIAEIVWSTQARAEQLPSNAEFPPLLENKRDSEKKS